MCVCVCVYVCLYTYIYVYLRRQYLLLSAADLIDKKLLLPRQLARRAPAERVQRRCRNLLVRVGG